MCLIVRQLLYKVGLVCNLKSIKTPVKLNSIFLKFFALSFGLIRYISDITKNFKKSLFSFMGILVDLELQTDPTINNCEQPSNY